MDRAQFEIATDCADDTRKGVAGREVAFALTPAAVEFVPALATLLADSNDKVSGAAIGCLHCAPEALQFLIAWAEWRAACARENDAGEEAGLAREMDADLQRDTGRVYTTAHAREIALVSLLHWNPTLMASAAVAANTLGMERAVSVLASLLSRSLKKTAAGAAGCSEDAARARRVYTWARSCEEAAN